ncbi:MAG: M56 family metallopeptidase [Oscillospiraceae bacterium]
MTDIFIKVIEMSMTASIVIGVVMVLRLFLRKAPKVFSYVLWAAALFRLLCPISFELPSAPIPSVEIPYSAEVDERNADGLFITHTDSEISPVPEYSAPQTEVSPQVTAVSESVPETPVKREINYIAIASYIWALAVIIMVFRGVLSWARLSRSLRSAQKMGGNVYVSPAISDPFIMGIIRPRIYLPTGLSCTESDLIIRHEKAHMHRGDHIAKLVMYIALCIHCFNPLVWLMFRLFERDMEMSCDEKVTENMTKEQKADYSQTLLKISAKPTAAFTACFGENGTKQRIKNVLSFKKPAVWVVILLAVAAVAVSVILCVSRENNGSSIPTDAVENDDTFTSEKMKEFFNSGVNPTSVGLSINNSEGLNFSEPFVIPFYNTAENSFSVVPYVWSSAVFQDDKLTALAMFSYQSGQATLKNIISLPSEFSDNISSGEKYSIFLVNAASNNGWDNGELMYAVNSNGNIILLKDERYDETGELNEAYPNFNAVCEYNCVSAKMEEAVTLEELNLLPDSPELTPTLGINGVLAYMKREDYYGRNNEKYERHSEAVTDEEKTKQYREQLYPEYGEAIEQCTFICEYFLVPLYDESGENVVDYFRNNCGITPILPDGEKLVILESENGEREVYPKIMPAELKSLCESYLTDYWSYIAKTGELDAKKYTSDENTAELIEVVKLEFADTNSGGVDKVEVEISNHNVEYDTIGDITWTYIRSYTVNWMNGGDIIRTEQGYNAYFEFNSAGEKLDLICEIDLWRWHDELGIDPEPYEFPLDIDVSEAAEKIYAGQGHSQDMDIISEMGLTEVIENSEWWDLVFCSENLIDIDSLRNTIEIDGVPNYSEYRITDDFPLAIPNIEKALGTELELADGYYKCPFTTVEEIKKNAQRLFSDKYIETVYKDLPHIKEYNGSIYSQFGGKGYPGGWIADAFIYDSSDNFIDFSATFVDGTIGTYSHRYKMIKEDGSWKIDEINYIA